jgi:CRP/FNR family transcriptional regulator, cyclic AMP receptor protein
LIRFFKTLLFDSEFQRKKAFLKGLVLFQDLRDADLGRLAQALHSRTYHAGETIFLEDDIGRALFVLEAGKVELTKKAPDGSQRKIFTVEPGEFFGEMALLEQLPRTASAVAVERSKLYLLYRSKLDALLSSNPRIGATIMTVLAQLLSARLRRASQVIFAENRP